ncbi:Agmatinase, mitochondrial [Chionoecetes opilio]|uniref:Agmatinase, mitochondrial n=1 Tax=Chionoecetes opilio TaxID=41210 RepID=A0A8J5CZB7_CHIOP|nr:Agmatinase, mitochondrial [Chionoecetes opilio]
MIQNLHLHFETMTMLRGLLHSTTFNWASFTSVSSRVALASPSSHSVAFPPSRPASSESSSRCLNKPLSSNDMPRMGGIASFMRLPVQSDTQGLDACFVGVPLDTGTSNRSGARAGPRQIRCESVLLRPFNSKGADPFSCLNVADVGDVRLNMYNLPEACEHIRQRFSEVIQNGCVPLTLGGDHTITYPILQAIKDRHGPVGLVHVDAHSDVSDTMLGAKITHGTPFRRALEEHLIDPHATVQIGLRGTTHTAEGNAWQIRQGFRVVPVEECWYRSLVPLMEEVRTLMGNRPVYLSFDIDAIDPGFCPGTGTPEIGGLTPIQALEVVRGCAGLNLVGCDLVEASVTHRQNTRVAPPYDFEGTTALTAANLLFEMLCVLPGVTAPR